MQTVVGDGVTGIKRCRHDLSSDDIRNLETTSGHGRLKEDLESSTWQRCLDYKTDCKTILTKLRTMFENAFNSEFKQHMQKYTRFNAQSFQDAMTCNMDSIGKYILEIILHQQQSSQLLKQKKLMQTQEDHSNTVQALNVDSLKVDLVFIQNTCSEKENSNSETTFNKLVKESNMNSEIKDMHAIKYKMSKAKERCMAYFVLFIHTFKFFLKKT
ncbi:hypothetical protein Tco_0411910 [Tanacetum coccineum]